MILLNLIKKDFFCHHYYCIGILIQLALTGQNLFLKYVLFFNTFAYVLTSMLRVGLKIIFFLYWVLIKKSKIYRNNIWLFLLFFNTILDNVNALSVPGSKLRNSLCIEACRGPVGYHFLHLLITLDAFFS